MIRSKVIWAFFRCWVILAPKNPNEGKAKNLAFRFVLHRSHFPCSGLVSVQLDHTTNGYNSIFV